MAMHVLGPEFLDQFELEGREGHEVVVETDMNGMFFIYVNGNLLIRTYSTDLEGVGGMIQQALNEANRVKSLSDSISQFVVGVREERSPEEEDENV